MSSSKDKRFNKIIKSMKKKFESHKYYEGQQMLKTLYSRLITQNKYDQASKLLSEGALTLMGHNKISEAVELVSDLIITWKQSDNKRLTKDRAELLHSLFCMIPQSDKQSINNFMRFVLQWIKELKKEIFKNNTKNEQNKLLNNIDINMISLYKSYGINLWNIKKYYAASQAFVKTDNANNMVNMFAEWSQLSTNTSKERSYYITRICLQYLCVANVKGCRQFINSVCPRNEMRGVSFRHPLENFCDLLCESIERKSVVLYNVVSKTYQPLLQIDSSLIQLLNRVGNTCLGIPLPKSGGLIGNLLSMLS